ncbi:MAG: SUMF1/EgtB/PvdO family nonheme iron enzyme [Phycisphaerales bacterium]|nr:SUMF1/EgtB/PvdO family nonheme iron enzyme [Phycisphaerales bacterium]
MGRYEITNAQFAAFLNDAQLDGGATGRGSNMYFQDDGRIRIADGGPTIFRTGGQLGITYNSSAPLGSRFGTQFVSGTDMSVHPVHTVSWFGALKFANWLTIDRGLGESERAYTEGATADGWHPVTISSMDWTTRDLNASERQALVNDVKGFRLPMDNHSATASAYNEFYKAAAWDPIDGVNHVYGFGRDTIDQRDANATGLNPNWPALPDDPFERGFNPQQTTPVGFYDGTNWQQSDWNWPDDSFATFQTRANENAYGVFDLSGNVMEWGQDQRSDGSDERALRGGSWSGSYLDIEGSDRNHSLHGLTDANIGFRVVAAPEPGAGAALLVMTILALGRRRS